MRKISRALGLAAIGSIVLLQACTSQEQVALQAAIPAYPEPYRAALQDEFRVLAAREAAQNDHLDAKRFMLRSEAAARAVTISPLPVDAYAIDDAAMRADLEAARARLVLLFDGGRARAPQALALAHASYECWLEEAEEGHQPADIQWCRDRFLAGEAATRLNAGLDADWGVVLSGDGGHVGAITLASKAGGETLLDTAAAAGFVNDGADVRDAAMTARESSAVTSDAMRLMPAAAKMYAVYFPSSAATLDSAARQAIAAAAADAADRPAPDIEILGFADRAGDDRSNYQLSERRVAAVRAALLQAGADEENFLIYARGENAPAVATPDGVAEARHRRVEITVR